MGLGTRLRHLLELLDGDIAKVYAERGMPEFRPRFVPFIRAIDTHGPSPIRDLARVVGVTHSAASQTVNHLARQGLVTLEPGRDARQRIVALTAKARALMPIIDAEWTATEAAGAEFEAELSFPLGELVDEALRALERRPFRERIAAHSTRS
jgi:DNA-binding MarR family transcriptional regulator